ncbi:MAG: hypothetical protein ACD_2C00150G0001 [uncultured bacterium (gcode 4)]|uniref:Uncharacterized protein n=1 Tax=uncultured bacterium (gcode 4) TaxID=1234023 RepID=K2G5K4_9BACT|nr:MAG: hypothetical protein ACD_2C00150G0001 [uncultured bacterium (gcode 4)]
MWDLQRLEQSRIMTYHWLLIYRPIHFPLKWIPRLWRFHFLEMSICRLETLLLKNQRALLNWMILI